ncbi:DUF6082 family protein [Streptomyces phaeochromogenes]|uniref:DUF6082 family protein n=1 Tax=Streptomyces phaeochromogenes TaxID=1923 RepID=UPI002DD9D3EC|nr:DUF6082 family protein [Streptomyces phaeochromogenes]WRZ31951.1 DUF6082 family protein [Streptomyces phaeochromogenes]
MSQLFARHRRFFTWTTAGLAIAAATLAAPLLLQAAAPAGTNWGRLSDISQTYAATLSAAALLGVALSLAHQSRQTAIANEEAQRASHRQLVVMSLSDPDLLVCWEPIPNAETALEAKRIGFTNLIISNWSADYQLKRFNDDALRVLLRNHFRGEIARKHWQNGGSQWLQFAEALGDSRGIQFVLLIDEAYAQAISEGPPIPPSSYYSPAE